MPTIQLPYPHKGQQTVRREAKRFNWLGAGRRWRKTTLAMSIAVESAARGGTYIWGAPTFDQVRIGFAETRRACGNVANFNISRMMVEFPTAGRIVFRSLDNPDNVRGWTADGVVIDECGNVKREAWVEVLRPMLIDTDGWAWGIGTPRGRNWFWQEHRKAADTDDATSWQVPTLGVEVTSDGLKRQPHLLENPEISFEEIKRLFETMPEAQFRQEIMADFVESTGGVFRRVNECAIAPILEEPEPDATYIAGVDVADADDFTVVCVMNSKTKALAYMDRFNKVGYIALEDRLAAIYERWNVVNMTIEDNSIGQPVIDHMRARGLHVTPFTTSNASKQPLIQGLQSAFEHDQISILPDRILIDELQAFEGERMASGYRYGAPAGYHDDCVMSLAIAYQSIASYIPARELYAFLS